MPEARWGLCRLLSRKRPPAASKERSLSRVAESAPPADDETTPLKQDCGAGDGGDDLAGGERAMWKALCCLACLLLCALPPLLWLALRLRGQAAALLGQEDAGVRWVLGRGPGRRSCDEVCAEDGGRACAEEELHAVSSDDALELAARLAGHACAGLADDAGHGGGMPAVCTSTECCAGNCTGSCARGGNPGGHNERCAERAPRYFSRLCPCRASYDDVKCSNFTWWPEKAYHASCGPCEHLVAMTTFHTCRDYCASFGHACFYAAAGAARGAAAPEHGCSIQEEASCSDNMSAFTHTGVLLEGPQHDNDMVCGCSLPQLGLAPAPAAQGAPDCSCDEPGESADYTCEDGSHSCRAGEVCHATAPFRSADWSTGCARGAAETPSAG